MTHAILSPSGAHRWSVCPGAHVLERAYPDPSGAAALEGTDAHELAADCLTAEREATAYIGKVMSNGTVVDQEMADRVAMYTDYVRAFGNDTYVETALRIDHITQEEGATGTADCVILNGTELVVIDLKYGYELVEAVDNLQLAMYAHAAYAQHSLVEDIETIRMAIVQPKRESISEWVVTVAELEQIIADLSAKAARAWRADSPDPKPNDWASTYLSPGEKQCRWCRAKGDCPALRTAALAVVVDDAVQPAELGDRLVGATERVGAVDDTTLAGMYRAIPLLKQFIAALEGEAEARAREGKLPGYKVVAGKQGNRRWTDAAEAEKLLKGMRFKVDEMYSHSLISPTQAEKLVGDNSRRWAKLEALITRADGAPAIVPEDDKRQALPAGLEGFTNLDLA